MEENKRTELGALGEFGLIDRIKNMQEPMQPSTIFGIGDDAAVLQRDEKTYSLVSTDLMVEGIHFDLAYHPLKYLGYKAIITNLSDICAMNGRPTQVTVSLALSNRFSVEAVEELYEGINEACRHYNVDLVGGDTTSSNKGLFISVTAIGVVAQADVTYRSGAKPTDIVCVTGDLGASYLGLQLLEREKQLFLEDPSLKPDFEEQQYLIQRQLKPEARLDVVQSLKEHKVKPTSMIDVSDGLASDIKHICKASNCGVLIEEGKVPLHDETEFMAIKFNLDPITTALNGGEDYELLFTVAEADYEKIRVMPGIYIIGEIKDKAFGEKLITTGDNIHDLKAQGWQHFE